MKRSFEKAKKAVERLFWDTCFVETFSEETAAWGESLHEKGEGETFPCRLTEKAEVCGTDGLLTQTEKTVILLTLQRRRLRQGVRCGFGGKTARSGATLRQERAVFF